MKTSSIAWEEIHDKIKAFWQRSEWCFFYTHLIHNNKDLNSEGRSFICTNTGSVKKVASGKIYCTYQWIWQQWEALMPQPSHHVCQSTFVKNKLEWIQQAKFDTCET